MSPLTRKIQNQIWLTTKRSWLGVAGICLVALLLRFAILAEFLNENPIAERPWTDSRVYWGMAEQMALGDWFEDTPFLSAPLYPYLLGVIRTLGGGLKTVYGIQLAMHIATAVLIAWLVRGRFGGWAGLVTCTLFLSLTEPAVSSTRILANTLQLLLVTLVWWRWSVLAEQQPRRWRDVMLAGALIGVLALSYPPAILLLPAYGLWLWWYEGWKGRAIGRAAVGMAFVALAISPATIHNAWQTGEIIPITAHSGITLCHGNSEKARGVYTPVRGISLGRQELHNDAARMFASRHGREGSWREIDAYFRGQAYEFWRADIGRSVQLFATKARWFFTACNYDDMMPVALEKRFGIGRRAILAPVATAWLLGLAVAGLIAVLRRPIKHAPEWVLTGLPLFVVLVFFYSPRYRLPAVPIICGLAAYALLLLFRVRYYWKIAIVTLALVPLPLYMWNRYADHRFDNPDEMLIAYRPLLARSLTYSGDTRWGEGDLKAAEERYRKVLEVAANHPTALRQLGALYLRQGKPAKAVRELQLAIPSHPTAYPEWRASLALVYRYLNNAFVELQRPHEAVWALREALKLEPDDLEMHLALAWLLATSADERLRDGAQALEHAQRARLLWSGQRADVLDVLAAAQAEAGRFDEAVETATMAVEAARGANDAALANAIAQRLAGYNKQEPCRATPRVLPVPEP